MWEEDTLERCGLQKVIIFIIYAAHAVAFTLLSTEFLLTAPY